MDGGMEGGMAGGALCLTGKDASSIIGCWLSLNLQCSTQPQHERHRQWCHGWRWQK